jgi:hypothetical protein
VGPQASDIFMYAARPRAFSSWLSSMAAEFLLFRDEDISPKAKAEGYWVDYFKERGFLACKACPPRRDPSCIYCGLTCTCRTRTAAHRR